MRKPHIEAEHGFAAKRVSLENTDPERDMHDPTQNAGTDPQ
jgi:hypothetical protein